MNTFLYGIDFTSAPRRAKAITVAHGELADDELTISTVTRLTSFTEFESLLQTPGPWIGGFDFPFGLPRELVAVLGWPQSWRALISHVEAIGKDAFKAALDRVREARPVGSKYIDRKGDRGASSSSPMKLVNPPVGLMFFEGAPRLAASGVSVAPCAPSADSRIALEAYPGFLARKITKESYKKDGKEGNTPSRIAARETLIAALPAYLRAHELIAFNLSSSLVKACIEDGSGDTLDAVLCAVQAAIAARAFRAGDERYGIPIEADDFEGWIIGVPFS